MIFNSAATVARVSTLLEQLDTTIAFGPKENGAFELSTPSTSAAGVRLYGYSLKQCQQTINSLLGFAGLRFEALPAVLAAHKAWKKHGGDWADHLIGAQMRALGCDVVLALDKAASRPTTHRKV